jgi:FkbM family methyltransferase
MATTEAFFSDKLGVVLTIESRECLVSRPGEVGHLVYGPYEPLSPGRYKVEYDLALSTSPTQHDPICANLDVTGDNGTFVLEQRFVQASELGSQLKTFVLEFTLRHPREVEYRVWSPGQVGLVVGRPRITLLTREIPGPRVKVAAGLEQVWDNESEFFDGYLQNVSGLIHIGANYGQERQSYRLLGLDVIWIEAIDEVFYSLVNNIARYPRQVAYKALLTDREGQEYDFNIANSGAGSSSILPMDKHAELFPEIQYVEHRKLVSTTFASLMQREGISTEHYQALTLDVEGAELLVLKGAGERLREFKYVKAEVADFVPRVGSTVTSELMAFMRDSGFDPLFQRPFAEHPGGGTFWDIVWKRKDDPAEFHRPGVRLPIIASPFDVFGSDKNQS